MFSLINAKVIVSYFVAACMILVGGGSLGVRYLVMVAASVGLDTGVSQDNLVALPSVDVSWGLLMGGLAVFGYRRTQERHIEQSAVLINQNSTMISQGTAAAEKVEEVKQEAAQESRSNRRGENL